MQSIRSEVGFGLVALRAKLVGSKRAGVGVTLYVLVTRVPSYTTRGQFIQNKALAD